MRTAITPDMLVSLYGWLAERAAAGQACPGNQEICDRFGMKSIATAAKAVARLESLRRISVVRGKRSRQVTITATGESTAPITGAVRTVRRREIAPVIPLPRRKGRKGKQCQWIEAEPTRDDSCKCLAETVPESRWCTAHHARAYNGYVPSAYRVDPKRIPA